MGSSLPPFSKHKHPVSGVNSSCPGTACRQQAASFSGILFPISRSEKLLYLEVIETMVSVNRLFFSEVIGSPGKGRVEA